MPDNDAVNSPNHYTKGGIECLVAMEASMTPIEFQGFLKGAVFKYLWRFRDKGNAAQDLGKAQYYLNMLAERAPVVETTPFKLIVTTGSGPALNGVPVR